MARTGLMAPTRLTVRTVRTVPMAPMVRTARTVPTGLINSPQGQGPAL